MPSTTFSASAAARRAGSLPWTAAIVPVVGLAVAIYLTGAAFVGVVAVATVVIAVPLAIRHARAQDRGEVEVTTDSVISRRGSTVLATVDRRAPLYDVVMFTDQHGGTPQLLVTDGAQHFRLVAGSWSTATLHGIAVTATDRPRTATWNELKVAHPEVLPFWQTHMVAIVVSVLVGIPVVAIVGGVLAVLLFDVG